MKTLQTFLFLFILLQFPYQVLSQDKSEHNKIPVIFDTDANNELDDQHALAYLLFSGASFKVDGITVNATYNGGEIDTQFAEAERVLNLCHPEGNIPLIKGANSDFEEIVKHLNDDEYDGKQAVDFILDWANKESEHRRVFLAVGKLTNIALAHKLNPELINGLRLVWLGSNYPEPGEYNLDNDIGALNYLLETDVHFEMVTVRYGKEDGTSVVRMLQGEAQKTMKNKGPKVAEAVEGRHGKTFDNFGDYSVSLFENCEYYGDPPGRSLYDMAAVAVLKNENWAKAREIPAPSYAKDHWKEQPENSRKIILWEHFDAQGIMEDFYATMNDYKLVNAED